MSHVPVALSVLDGQFYLQSLLAATEQVRTYRATHASGMEMVVKIVFEADEFFDRLARHYALDQSAYFAPCLCNYPPSAYSGVDPLIGYQEPLPEGVAPDQVGVLVLDWVEGLPFSTFLEGADEMEGVDAILELTLALKVLERQGICHGHLSAEHVLVEQDSRELKLIGLGTDPADWQPDDEQLLRKGLADDIRVLAKAFMPLLKGSGTKFKKFQAKCLETQAAEVDLDELYRQIKLQRKRKSPRHSLEILFSFFKPLHLLAWLLFVWFASLALNRLLGDGEVPVQKRRVQILQNPEYSDATRVFELRKLYEIAEDPAIRELLAKDLSQFTHDRVIHFSAEDAAHPIAVMAFRSRPAIIGRESLVRIGDWLDLGDRFGYVSAIEFNRVKLSYEDAFSWHVFERPRVFRGLIFGSEIVVVWENENNLDRLLSALAELFNLHYVHQDLAKNGDRPLLTGKVSGIFEARGGLDTFITELNEAISVHIEGDDLIYQATMNTLPVYYKSYYISMQDLPIEIYAARLGENLGVPVKLDAQLAHEKLTLSLYNATWQEAIEAMHLRYLLEMENDLVTLVLIPEKGDAAPNH